MYTYYRTKFNGSPFIPFSSAEASLENNQKSIKKYKKRLYFDLKISNFLRHPDLHSIRKGFALEPPCNPNIFFLDPPSPYKFLRTLLAAADFLRRLPVVDIWTDGSVWWTDWWLVWTEKHVAYKTT